MNFLTFSSGASLGTSLIMATASSAPDTVDILDVVIFTIPALGAHVDVAGAIAINAAVMGFILGWGAIRKRRKEQNKPPSKPVETLPQK